MNTLTYIKIKRVYYICIESTLNGNVVNNISSKDICEFLNISFEEYTNNVTACGGGWNPRLGWFLPNEDTAIKCIVLLNLIKK